MKFKALAMTIAVMCISLAADPAEKKVEKDFWAKDSRVVFLSGDSLFIKVVFKSRTELTELYRDTAIKEKWNETKLEDVIDGIPDGGQIWFKWHYPSTKPNRNSLPVTMDIIQWKSKTEFLSLEPFYNERALAYNDGKLIDGEWYYVSAIPIYYRIQDDILLTLGWSFTKFIISRTGS